MSLQKKFELGDLSKILKLVPEKRQEGEKYIRAEKDGYYSLLTDNGDLNYTMLNITSKYILDLCDGNKNVEEILKKTSFKEWHFGHHHKDICIEHLSKKFFCHYKEFPNKL